RRLVIDQQHLDLHRSLRPFGAQHHVVGPAQLLHFVVGSPRFPKPHARRLSQLKGLRVTSLRKTLTGTGVANLITAWPIPYAAVSLARTLQRCLESTLDKQFAP